MPKILPILFVVLLLPSFLKATHIVGGEMTYTCLGNNQYEINLTIFRDCFYGNPNAWFDDPASIGVFNASNQLLFEVQIDLIGNDTLEPILSGECFVVPPDVCVHTTTYTTIVELPPIIGGYQLAYQRCCRNQTIVNIIDPLDSGATYGVTISEQALLECNSSPKFQAWPPLYICVNEPIVFDQSAIDVDGDSIVYRLCTPLLGATPDIPQPQPPNNPPYDPINWVSPPYGVDNMLNGLPGGEPLEINMETGLLTGLPNTIGHCVEEYRDGELIATTRRDFQYNVGVCGQAVSSFFAPEIQCQSFTVEFDNQSLGADDYLWFFNDPNNPDASTTDPNPSYTYQDTGLYTIMLVAEPGSICQDTSFQEVYIQYNSLFPDFDIDVTECSDSVVIEVNDLTVDTISTPVEWTWTLLQTGETSDLQNPSFVIDETGFYTLELLVTAENGCEQTVIQSLAIELIENDLPDTIAICPGDSINLNNGFNPDYSYVWSPPDGLDDPFSPNPLASPTDTTTYSVQITAFNGECQTERSITVLVPEPIVIDLPPDQTTCEPDLLLIASSNTGISYNWSTDPNFNVIFEINDSITVTPFGENTYYLQVRDELGCYETDSVTIIGNGVNVALIGNTVQCEGDVFGLAALNMDSADTLSYNWYPTDNIILGEDTSGPIFNIEESGEYTVYLDAENQFGCTITDSILVTVLDTMNQISFETALQCSGYNVQFSSNNMSADFYVWDFGDPTNPGATAAGETAAYTYPGPGEYTVTVTLNSLVPCPDTLMQTVIVEEPQIELAFDWEYVSCGDSAVVQFTDLSTNAQSSFTGREWLFSTGEQSTLPNPSITVQESQQVEVTLIQNSSDGCIDSLVQLISIELIEEEISDTLGACVNEPLPLNPDFNPDYTYQWAPDGGLDDPSAANPQATLNASANYTVTITDASGDCVIERDVFVFVPPAIEYEIPNDTSICDPEFLLYANSDQASSFLWSEHPDFSNPFSFEPEVVVIPDRPSIYYIQLVDEFGCIQEDSIEVEGNGIDVIVQDGITICIGDSAIISVLNFSDDDLIYTWSPSAGILSGADTGTPVVSPSISTNYTVSVMNELGCASDTSIQVNIFDFVPPLDISADPDTLVGPGETQLNSTFDPNYNYDWSPDALLDDWDISDPIATLEETTTFTLTIEDQNGCSNEKSLTVVVLDLECRDPFIFIPKGFTPDGDGLNDQLFVRGNAIDELYLAIFNRWGEKVFETDNKEIGWDGTFNGKALSSDVYGYYLEVSCFNGQEYFKKGNITLLR